MKKVRTEIIIDAPPERVWEMLTDFPAFPEWNPFIRSARGELRVGAQLAVSLKPPKGMGMTFKPKVLKAERNRELCWLGRLLISGLFDGEHSFTIEPLELKGVRFIQREAFTGVLVPLFALMGLFKNTSLGFEAMNQALKARAEGKNRHTSDG
jgi:hypothetical protein